MGEPKLNTETEMSETTATDPVVAALDEKRKRSGITADAMLKRAGVSASTHWGWFHGAEARIATVRRCDLALDEILAEQGRGPTLKEFTFDVKFLATVRVVAESEAAARGHLAETLASADANLGAWIHKGQAGEPILAELSLDGFPDLNDVGPVQS